MVRDFNLIRRILLEVEAAPAGKYLNHVCDDVDQTLIAEYIKIMCAAELLEGEVIYCFNGSPRYTIKRLTWKGHDFLANAKNDTIWKKVMVEAREKGTSMTMVVVNGLLTKAAQKYAGLE